MEEINSNLYLPLIYGGAGLVGLISCFFGFKLFRLIITAVLAITGAIGFAYLGFEYGTEPYLWSAIGLFLGAVIGIIFAFFFYSLAVGTIGALFAATYILPWIQDMQLEYQWIILAVVCTVAALIASKLTNIMIQLGTAMLGALLMIHSALFFTTGQTVYRAVDGEESWVLYLYLDSYAAIVAIAIGLVGFVIQRRMAK